MTRYANAASTPLQCRRCGWTHGKETASAQVGICRYCDYHRRKSVVRAYHNAVGIGNTVRQNDGAVGSKNDPRGQPGPKAEAAPKALILGAAIHSDPGFD